MKQLSLLTKIMFCIVAILLVITIVLGIMTAVKDSKDKNDKKQGISTTTVTPIPTPSLAPENEFPTLTVTPTPEPTVAAVTGGHKIALDPGQQKSQMTEEEPVGPGASATTAKMSYGATSTTTGKREYEWSMEFTVRLKANWKTGVTRLFLPEKKMMLKSVMQNAQSLPMKVERSFT